MYERTFEERSHGGRRRPVVSWALAILVFAGTQGCLRYVPSSQELEKKNGSTDAAISGVSFGGEKEFQAYEAQLRARLEALVAERAHLLDQGAEEGSYKLGAGDVVSLSVLGFDDLKGESEISPNGTVTFPLVGELALAGQSVQQARATLTQRYAKFVRAPKVELSLKSYQANRVSVIGEVAKPGIYPLKRNGQLLTELLSEAGGRKDGAANRIVLMPARSSAPQNDTSGVEIDVEELVGGVGRRPLLVPLVPGDTVFVPEAGTFEVDGEVDKPGSYKLSARTSVIGAVAAAGGFTYSANVNQVEVIRDLGSGQKALLTLDLENVGLRGGADVRLRNGDLVRVPSEPGRHFKRQIVEALNTVFRGVGVQAR